MRVKTWRGCSDVALTGVKQRRARSGRYFTEVYITGRIQGANSLITLLETGYKELDGQKAYVGDRWAGEHGRYNYCLEMCDTLPLVGACEPEVPGHG